MSASSSETQSYSEIRQRLDAIENGASSSQQEYEELVLKMRILFEKFDSRRILYRYLANQYLDPRARSDMMDLLIKLFGNKSKAKTITDNLYRDPEMRKGIAGFLKRGIDDFMNELSPMERLRYEFIDKAVEYLDNGLIPELRKNPPNFELIKRLRSEYSIIIELITEFTGFPEFANVDILIDSVRSYLTPPYSKDVELWALSRFPQWGLFSPHSLRTIIMPATPRSGEVTYHIP